MAANGYAAHIMIVGRKSMAGPSIAETQEIRYFCAEKSIVSGIDMISTPAMRQAYDHLVQEDVNHWFGIDMATL
ncbi:hypothetical protein GCM10028773_48440 [Spirosoma koreense]